jgi:aryl-alcohol dehydrogenase-like predicted oxidoreductase
VHAALEAGLDVLETAEDAEALVGGAVRDLRVRDRVVVACRVPALAPAGARPGLVDRLPAGHVRARVEAALRATRLDAIPLVQLELQATWRASSAWPELTGACARLVREGKVLAWSAWLEAIADDSSELCAEDWLVALSVPLNLCERGAEPLVAAAADRGRAVLARRPLAGGALAGALGPGVQLRPSDDRRMLTDRELARMAVAAAKLAAFTSHVPAAAHTCDASRAQLENNPRDRERHAATIAELALRWVLDRGAIALPRLHRREHVAEAVRAAAAPPLPDGLLADLDI